MVFRLALKCLLSLSFLMPFSLTPSYSSTCPPTPNKKGKRREKRRNQGNRVNLLMLVHSLWNAHYYKVSNTHRHTSWWWNSSAPGTGEEPSNCNHRRSYKICYLALQVAHCALSLRTGTILRLVCWLEVLRNFSDFQPKCSYCWEFLPISAYLAVFPVTFVFRLFQFG